MLAIPSFLHPTAVSGAIFVSFCIIESQAVVFCLWHTRTPVVPSWSGGFIFFPFHRTLNGSSAKQWSVLELKQVEQARLLPKDTTPLNTIVWIKCAPGTPKMADVESQKICGKAKSRITVPVAVDGLILVLGKLVSSLFGSLSAIHLFSFPNGVIYISGSLWFCLLSRFPVLRESITVRSVIDYSIW